MLKLLMPMISLLMLKSGNYKWFSHVLVFFMCFIIMLINYMCYEFDSVKLSKWSMLDMVSFLLIILTIWVGVMMLLSSMKIKIMAIKDSAFLHMCLFLMLSLFLCLSFSNLLMFYIAFELTLVPTMLLILLWGYQPERIQASMYMMVYTILGSLPMLCCFIFMSHVNSTYMFFMWFMFYDHVYIMKWWGLFMLGFLFKLPMYPFHLWLPKAHVEAPVAGSVVLAAILLKLGGYGLIRLSMIYPYNNLALSSIIISVSLVGGLITSLMCIRQNDLKSLIAYSSVSHMGLMLSSLMTSTNMGLKGAMIMMIGHGFTSSGLFMLANLIYEKCNTRSLMLCKGVIIYMPMMSLLWFIFSVMNMSAPPFMNLFGEVMILTSMTSKSFFTIMMFSLISFITLCYSLNMYSMINHGNCNQHAIGYFNMVHKDFYYMFLLMLSAMGVVFKLSVVLIF